MTKLKDYDYFNNFLELIGYSYQSALMLHDVTKNYHAKALEKYIKDMHEIEHAADLSKHVMMQRLAAEFIAPIEREDIVHLAQHIDTITDCIEDVLITLHMYNISHIKPEFNKFTNVIVQCCSTLITAMKEFSNFRKSQILKDKLIEVNRLEETGDTLYYDTVHQLYQNVQNPIELFVWSDIYAKLEKCTDACEHTADIMESIIMKNS